MLTPAPVSPASSEMHALQQAHDLMQEMRSTSGLPEDVRNDLTFCLRHFPDRDMFQYDYWNQIDEDAP
jgi:hypothetical protein